MPLLLSIGRALIVALGVYGAVRIARPRPAGVLGEAFSGSREAAVLPAGVRPRRGLPMVLLASPLVRRNSGRLYAAAVLVVAGFIVNRLNVSITGLEAAQGGHYVPTVFEGIITIMLVGVGVAAFGIATRFLPVMAHVEDLDPLTAPERPRQPVLAPAPVRT